MADLYTTQMLHEHAMENNVKALEKMMQNFSQHVDAQDANGMTALHQACLRNHVAVIEHPHVGKNFAIRSLWPRC